MTKKKKVPAALHKFNNKNTIHSRKKEHIYLRFEKNDNNNCKERIPPLIVIINLQVALCVCDNYDA